MPARKRSHHEPQPAPSRSSEPGPIGLEAALAAAERGLDFTVYEAAASVGRPRAPLGPRAHLHPVGHERVGPRARRAGRARPLGATRCPPATSWPMACSSRSPPPAAAGRHPPGHPGARRRPRGPAQARGDRRRASAPRARSGCSSTGPGGAESIERADAVIDCSGTYGNPNRLGDGGIPAPGERSASRTGSCATCPRFDESHWDGARPCCSPAPGTPRRPPRARSPSSRATPGTRVVWAVRQPRRPTGAPSSDDPLPERASLNARRGGARRRRVARRRAAARHGHRGARRARRPDRRRRCATADVEEVVVDRILALNGGVGDALALPPAAGARVLRDVRADEARRGAAGRLRAATAWRQASHGPETLANPEPGFFILGAKSYGRNSQFLLRDRLAAGRRRVRLPTGVTTDHERTECPTTPPGRSTKWRASTRASSARRATRSARSPSAWP